MNNYEILYQEWSEIRRTWTQQEVETFRALCLSEDEQQVSSTLSILLAYGTCALCEVLTVQNTQFRVHKVAQPIIWECAILSWMMEEDSVWSNLYEHGLFLAMERSVYGGVAVHRLSARQQNRVYAFSLRFVEAPAGSFLMGALPHDDVPI